MKPGVSPDTFPPRGHEAKRLSIVDAAAGVFCREGFVGANIDLIAADLYVSGIEFLWAISCQWRWRFRPALAWAV